MQVIKDYGVFNIVETEGENEPNFLVNCIIDNERHTVVHAQKLEYLMETMMLGEVVKSLDKIELHKFNGYMQSVTACDVKYTNCVGIECKIRNNLALFRTDGDVFIITILDGMDDKAVRHMELCRCGDPKLSDRISNIIQQFIP